MVCHLLCPIPTSFDGRQLSSDVSTLYHDILYSWRASSGSQHYHMVSGIHYYSSRLCHTQQDYFFAASVSCRIVAQHTHTVDTIPNVWNSFHADLAWKHLHLTSTRISKNCPSFPTQVSPRSLRLGLHTVGSSVGAPRRSFPPMVTY